MIFEQSLVECSPYMQRWVSQGGKWEVGFAASPLGLRVCVGPVNCNWCTVEYDGGPDEHLQDELMRVVKTILLSVEETVSERELQAIFPRARFRPVFIDPVWLTLSLHAAAALNVKAS